MSGQILDLGGVEFKAYNIYRVIMEATENEATSPPLELRANTLYSLLASKMVGAADSVFFKMEIFDSAKNAWQDAAQGGGIIKMSQDREIITIEGVSAIVRFYKPPTLGQPLGLSLAYFN